MQNECLAVDKTKMKTTMELMNECWIVACILNGRYNYISIILICDVSYGERELQRIYFFFFFCIKIKDPIILKEMKNKPIVSFLQGLICLFNWPNGCRHN